MRAGLIPSPSSPFACLPLDSPGTQPTPLKSSLQWSQNPKSMPQARLMARHPPQMQACRARARARVSGASLIIMAMSSIRGPSISAPLPCQTSESFDVIVTAPERSIVIINSQLPPGLIITHGTAHAHALTVPSVQRPAARERQQKRTGHSRDREVCFSALGCEAIFLYTNRDPKRTEKYFVRVEAAMEFPFTVTKMPLCYNR